MKKIFSIIVCFISCIAIFFSFKVSIFANSNKYVYNAVLYSNINASIVIEDWQSSNEWFISNNTSFTTIRLQPQNDYVDMYFENVNNGNVILVCRFRTALGGDVAIPYYASQNYEVITIKNFPYENYDVFNNMFTEYQQKTNFNVSIGQDYIFDFTKPNYDLSLNVVYYGVFKMEWNGEIQYFEQMMFVDTNQGYAVALNFANDPLYTQGTAFITSNDEKTILIERMYVYNTSEFPSYITLIPIDINNWSDFFYAIIDVPLYYLYSLTNFEIFGINVWLGIGSLVVVGLLVYLVKRLW